MHIGMVCIPKHLRGGSSMSELTALSATELPMLYRRKAVSPVEVVEAVLARIAVSCTTYRLSLVPSGFVVYKGVNRRGSSVAVIPTPVSGTASTGWEAVRW